MAEAHPDYVTSTAKEGTTLAVIDHLGYPHIVALILEYATSEVLWTFSTTCKTYHAYCRRLVARHLVLTTTGDAHDTLVVHVRSSRGPLPWIQSWSATPSPRQHQSLLHRRRLYGEFFKLCTVLDVWSPSCLDFTVLGPALRNIETIRVFESPLLYDFDFFRSIPTVVSYGPVRLDLLPFENPRLSQNNSAVTTAADGPQRKRQSSIRTLPSMGSTRIRWSLNDLVDGLSRVPEDGGVCTIVDFDTVPLSVLNLRTRTGDRRAGTFEERTSLFMSLLESHTAARASFMTGKEYCEKYGCEQYDLETCQEK